MKAYVYKVVLVLPDDVDPEDTLNEAFGSDDFLDYMDCPYAADYRLLDDASLDYPNVPDDAGDDADRLEDAWYEKARAVGEALLER